MKVGVLPVVDRDAGGVYQYSTLVLHALDRLRESLHPVVVHDHPGRLPVPEGSARAWETVSFGSPTARLRARATLARAIGEPATKQVVDTSRKSYRRIRSKWSVTPGPSVPLFHPRDDSAAWLRRHGIDLMVYPSPTNISYELGLPYVMAVHDLQHRIHPEFPEVSADGEWEAREHLYTNAARTAQMLVVDSEIGREDVLEFYGHLISRDRIRVLPFVPPPYLTRPADEDVAEVAASLGLEQRYLLFPAQFWPHKNHRRVVEAVATLQQAGHDVSVVLTGSSTGDIRGQVLRELRALIEANAITRQVRILGYVDDTTMACLYAGATGVLLPTFFGPTNIPVIEAWAMGVPVLSSDIRGIREQCGEAALLVDPTSVEGIAEGIRKLWVDETMRQKLTTAGSERLRSFTLDGFTANLGSILRDVEGSLSHPRIHQTA